MSAVFTMHSHPVCPGCRSVLMAASYLNLNINVKNYDLPSGEHRTPHFRKMNPHTAVPTIDDDGFYLWESRAILSYLLNKYAPDSNLYPRDPRKRAVVDRMLYFDLGTLYKAQADIVLPRILRGEVVDSTEKWDAYRKALASLDCMLQTSVYVAGDHVTIADLSILASLTFAETVNISLEDYPAICSWLKKLRSEIPKYEEINDIPIREYKEYLKSMNFIP